MRAVLGVCAVLRRGQLEHSLSAIKPVWNQPFVSTVKIFCIITAKSRLLGQNFAFHFCLILTVAWALSGE